MKAILVRLNGKRLCTAGVGPNGVLTAIVNWVGGGPRRDAEGHFGFHVGGLDSRTGEHVEYETPGLKVGDKVTVEIIEGNQVDRETKRVLPTSRATGEGRSPGRQVAVSAPQSRAGRPKARRGDHRSRGSCRGTV